MKTKYEPMPRFFLTALILACCYTISWGQEKCDITNHFGNFMTVEKKTFNDRDFLRKKVVETENSSCYSALIDNHIQFVDYLLTHFSSKDNYQQLLNVEDSLELRRQFLTGLKNDSLFTHVMTEFVEKAAAEQLAKDTVSMDDLLSVAVKFFSITKINEKGHYSVKVCTGRNEIESTEKVRKPFVEAFAFTSIMEHYRGEYDLYGEFVQVVKKIYKVHLGIDEDERLLRAQGAMFLLMRENEPLREMLISEYEENKMDLPFVLKRDE